MTLHAALLLSIFDNGISIKIDVSAEESAKWQMKIAGIDHIVLTVKDIETTCVFYGKVLGMNVISFGEGRKALSFGNQKINLHQHGSEFEPKANKPTPGSADVCFITSAPIPEVILHLEACGVELLEVKPKNEKST